MKRKYYRVTVQELPEEVEQILLGSLMGDADVYYSADYSCVKYLEPHGRDQVSYLNYKAENAFRLLFG